MTSLKNLQHLSISLNTSAAFVSKTFSHCCAASYIMSFCLFWSVKKAGCYCLQYPISFFLFFSPSPLLLQVKSLKEDLQKGKNSVSLRVLYFTVPETVRNVSSQTQGMRAQDCSPYQIVFSFKKWSGIKTAKESHLSASVAVLI